MATGGCRGVRRWTWIPVHSAVAVVMAGLPAAASPISTAAPVATSAVVAGPEDPPIAFDVPRNTSAGAEDFPGGASNNEISFPNLAAGDMNGDGFTDLVPAWFPNCCGANGGVAVMLGLGDGTFGEPVPAALTGPGANRVMGVGLGDFDEDGDLDVFGTVPQRQEYDLWLNDGSGALGAPTFTPLPARPGDDLKVVDLDGDDHLDVVAGGSQDGSITALYGRGDGTFDVVPIATGQGGVTTVVVGDFDGQGSLDVAWSAHYSYKLSVALATAARLHTVTSTPIPFTTGSHLFAADFDGDGTTDLGAVGWSTTQGPLNSSCTSCMATMAGNGDGTFRVPAASDLAAYSMVPDSVMGDNVGQGWGPNSPDPVDVDGDGDLDAVFALPGYDGLVLMARNDGDGRFDVDVHVGIADDSGTRVGSYQSNADNTDGTGQFVRGVVVDDLDDDGAVDLVVAGEEGGPFTSNRGAIAVTSGDPAHPGELLAPRLSAGSSSSDLFRAGFALADWDGDGDKDAITVRFSDWRAVMFENVGGGRFADAIDIHGGLRGTFNCIRTGSEQLLESGDLDGDGHDDIVCRGANAGGQYALSVWFGDGDGGADLVTVDIYSGATSMPPLHLADIDGDDDLDLLDTRATRCGPCQMSTALFRNEGGRTFQPAGVVEHGPVDQFQLPIAPVDVDNDGDLDLVSRPGTGTDPPLCTYLNDGSGTFGAPTSSQPVVLRDRNLAVHTIVAGDLNGDGNQDLVIEKSWDYRSNIGALYTGGLFVMLGNGDGTFSDPTEHVWGGGAGVGEGLVDLDLDGELDLPVNPTHWGVEALRGRGDGTFEPVERYWAGTLWAFATRAADLDGDGRPEIVKLRQDNFGLVVLHNSSGGVPVGPSPDLSVTQVDVAAEVVPGANSTVSATIHNAGGQASGRWTDQVWLSADDTVDAGDRLLGSVERTTAVGETDYQIEVTAAFDPLVDGDHRIIVRTDARRQLEESDETNNVLIAPNAVKLDIAELDVGTPSELEIAAGGVQYLRIAGPTPQLALSLAAEVADVADVDIVRGRVPVPARELSLGDPSATRRTISLPDGEGDWFLRIAGRAGAGSGTTATIEAEQLEFGLFSSSPSRGSNLGQATLQIAGAGLSDPATVRLVGGPGDATSRSASSTPVDDGHATATLDLRGVPEGRYDLEVVRIDGGVAALSDAFTVTDGAVGHLELYTSAPPSVRPGWSGQYVVTVRNTGDTDLDVDSLVVRGTTAQLRLPGRTSYADREVVFLPGDPAGPLGAAPAGALSPGESRRVVVEFLATGDGARLTAELFGRDAPDAPEDPPDGLVVDHVDGPDAITSGEPSALQFRIRNTGSTPLRGPWSLQAGLVGEPELLDGALVTAPRFSDREPVEVGAGVELDPGEQLDATATISAPDAPDGTARWLVTWPEVDPGIVTEGADLQLKASFEDDPPDAASWSTEPVDVQARGLAVGAPASFALDAGESRLVRLDSPTGPTAVGVTVVGTEALEVTAAAGAVPAGGAVDDEETVNPGTPGRVELVTTDGADYLVVGPAGSGGADVQLLAATPTPGIEAVTPGAGGNAGDVTVALHGAGLDAVSGVDLVAGDGTRHPARQWSMLDSFDGSATFDLRGLAPGGYTIEAGRDGADPLVAPFAVTEGGAGQLVADVVPPDRMRLGAPNPVTVTYANTGTVDLPLPLLTVQAREGGRLSVVTDRSDADADTTLIPPSPVAGTGVLPAGSAGSLTLWYTPPSNAPDDVTFDIWASDFADASLAHDPMDWSAIGDATRPAGVDDAAWAAQLAEERARYGETYGDLSSYVAEEYASMAALGLERAVFADGEWLFFARTAGRPGTFRSGGVSRHSSSPAAEAVPAASQTDARLLAGAEPSAEGDGIQNVRAVIVGNPDGTLSGAERDADQFASLLTKTYNIPKANVVSLLGANATFEVTTGAIDRAKTLVDADDLLVVMVATHGDWDSLRPDDPTRATNLLADRRIDASQWNAALSGSPSKVLFLLDTCNSANITNFVTAPNVTTLASSDFAQSVPDNSYTQKLVQELQKNPRGDFYATAQKAGDRQLVEGIPKDYGGVLTDAGRDYVATWRNWTIDRPVTWTEAARDAARAKVKEHGYDWAESFSRQKYLSPLYPTLDRHGNASLSINPPDPKRAATTSRGGKQKQSPPTKTKKTKVDAGEPVKKPSDELGKEGTPTEKVVVRGDPTESQASDVSIARSMDPNEIVGPAGAGEPRWLSSDSELAYEVRFENLGPGSAVIPPGQSVATAPAALVDVETILDPDVDLSTFALGEFGVGNGVATSGYPTVRFTPPAGAQGFSQDQTISVPVYGTSDPPVELLLRGEASLDPLTRKVRWTITALDPATGAIPVSPMLGFLPPEDATSAGQGFARYLTRSLPDVTAGTVVSAEASIVFDDNDAIVTNRWDNSMDRRAPEAVVDDLPATSPAQIPVSWSGADDGSGVATYDVFVSVDGGPLQLWLDDVEGTSGTYPGVVGREYGFAASARDAVGHAGPEPDRAQVSTQATETSTSTTTSTTTTTTTVPPAPPPAGDPDPPAPPEDPEPTPWCPVPSPAIRVVANQFSLMIAKYLIDNCGYTPRGAVAGAQQVVVIDPPPDKGCPAWTPFRVWPNVPSLTIARYLISNCGYTVQVDGRGSRRVAHVVPHLWPPGVRPSA